MSTVAYSRHWLINPDGSVSGSYPFGDKPPAGTLLAWDDALPDLTAIEVGTPFSTDVRSLLTGSESAAAVIDLVNYTGAEPIAAGWTAPDAGDNLAHNAVAAGSGRFQMRATSGSGSVNSSDLPWTCANVGIWDGLWSLATLWDLYDRFIRAKGGSPVPLSRTRYWDKPTYPSSGSPITMGSTISTPGTYYVTDGSKSGTITLDAPNVTLYAQTRGGVTLTGNSKFVINGSDCTLMGFNWPIGINTQVLLQVNAAANRALIAYLNILTTGRSGNPATETFQTNLINLKGTEGRVTQCTTDGYQSLGKFVGISQGGVIARYNRVDHCHALNKVTTNTAYSQNDNEIFQIGQDQADVDMYGMLDHNYDYHWNRIGDLQSAAGVEGERWAIKSSSNFMAQNVSMGSHGSFNLREAHDCLLAANYIFGDGLPTAGGIGIWGHRHLVALNYLAHLNSGGSQQHAALRFGNGDDLSSGYFAARDCEASFNTLYNCRKPIQFSHLSGLSVVPTDNKFFNNLVGVHPTNDAITVHQAAYQDTGSVWGGNVIQATVGRTATTNSGVDAGSGITTATPGITSSAAGVVRLPDVSGNADSGRVAGYNALITTDAFGNALTTKKGPFHVNTLAVNPWQAIINSGGSAA